MVVARRSRALRALSGAGGMASVAEPAAVLLPENTAEVVAALRFAREWGLPLTVRSGGHGLSGRSANDGGVVFELKPKRGKWTYTVLYSFCAAADCAESVRGPEAAARHTIAAGWSPSSWRLKKAEQLPAYPDAGALARVERRLEASPARVPTVAAPPPVNEVTNWLRTWDSAGSSNMAR